MLEISRYLLLKGATLVYGGHLGSESYTRKLMEIVRTHNHREGVDPVDRIENYVGWPLPFTKEQRAKYKYEAVLVRVSRPDGIDETLHEDFVEDPSFFPGDKSAIHRYAWARGMTAMREVETGNTVCRIVLGGTFGPTEKSQADGGKAEKWYFGRIPGLLEEIIVSAEACPPVFLIGAFGGAASLAIDLLEGIDRPEAAWDYQKRAPFAGEMRELYEKRNDKWTDYPQMVELLRNKGYAGLNPLLDEAQSRELARTRDTNRMIELIMQGLDNLP